MNTTTIIFALCGFLLGGLIGFINSRITKTTLDKQSTGAIMAANVARYTLAAVLIIGSFFICRKLAWPVSATLIGEALGVTLIGMLSLLLVTKQYKKQQKTKER